MSRKTKNQLPAAPIEFPRADPAELAKFDPSTKICTMNCGRHTTDSRSPAERKLLCDDCIPVLHEQPAPSHDDIIRMGREAGLLAMWAPESAPYLVKVLGRFHELATERELAARQAAQVENEELKARLARAGIEQRKAVMEEREACARICDTTPPEPFRPSIEAAHTIRARGRT